MKRLKKSILSIVLCLAMVIGNVNIPAEDTLAAKKPKLNKTKLTLSIGKKYKLKVRNYKGKIVWKSSRKKVATVKKNGVVKARKKGTAKVTARLKKTGKKLSCKVTVKKAVSHITDTGIPDNITTPLQTNIPDTANTVNNTTVPSGNSESNITTVPGSTDAAPTAETTSEPTIEPTAEPTVKPTPEPTTEPTAEPTVKPTLKPTVEPTAKPTVKPTLKPTVEPTVKPTSKTTAEPTAEPTVKPTPELTAEPTAVPTVKPTSKPASEPTATPATGSTVEPSAIPVTKEPDVTKAPTAAPQTEAPATKTPSSTAEPTKAPLAEGEAGKIILNEVTIWDRLLNIITFGLYELPEPSVEIVSNIENSTVEYIIVTNGSTEVMTEEQLAAVTTWETYVGKIILESDKNVVYAKITDNEMGYVYYLCTDGITSKKTETPESSAEPTAEPVTEPTAKPTAEPTAEPATEPTAKPIAEPTAEPATVPTAKPSAEPTAEPVTKPTVKPSAEPTTEPVTEPTVKPSTEPTAEPVTEPTVKPSTEPTAEPVTKPTVKPSAEPTTEPVTEPTVKPSTEPTAEPVTEPTVKPTAEPTAIPVIEKAGKITLTESQWWESLLSFITFGLYEKTQNTFTIESYIDDSDIYYYVVNDGKSTALSVDELNALPAGTWKRYTDEVTLKDEYNVVYAKIFDIVTQTAYYISTDGIRFEPDDTQAPEYTATPVPEITYKLKLDSTVSGAESTTLNDDGSVTYKNVEYVLIPLPKSYPAGEKLNVKVYGSAEGSTPRLWISEGAWTSCSNQVSPYTFGQNEILTTEKDNGNYLQVKAASSGAKFTTLTISAVYISKGTINEDSSYIPGTEPTATPLPGPTQTPAKLVTADDAYVEENIPSDYKDTVADVEYGRFILNDTYYSNIPKSNRSLNIALPANYDKDKKYPVVYVLHGIGCNKDMFGTSMDTSSIAKIAANLRAQDKAKDMIIVFANVRVSDTAEDNMHSDENYKYYDAVREDIIDNIMPHMSEKYNAATGRENTAVCGWSMGGREALYIGLSKPEIFGYCAGFCPAYGLLPYTNDDVGQSEDGLLTAGDGSADIITLPDEYINNTYVQVSHGIYDSVVHDEPKRYHNALTAGNVPHVYTEYPSGHSDGVYDPGFYVFASNIFKTTEPEESWTTTWGTAEEPVENQTGVKDFIPLNGTSVRQIIKVTTSGSKFRLRLSNQYGSKPVQIESMHIAKQGADADKSDIDISTDTVVTYNRNESFEIPAGKVIVTDAIDFTVNALENIAVTSFFGDRVPSAGVTGHRGARATTYQVTGNQVSAESFDSLSGYKTCTGWFFLADASVWMKDGKAVVCFGDSITDGYGTDAAYLGKKPDSYTRWGDYFARRLQANESTKNVSVINEGIGGNSIFGGLGPAGRTRFERDIAEHDNVKYCILLFGVNDMNQLSDTSMWDKMKPEYEKMIATCHNYGVKVYAAPILPFGTSSYYSEGSEAVRTLINSWFRSEESGVDGIIDFESAVADPDNPKNILKKYTHDDGLHPYDGYEAMADAIDLKMFEDGYDGGSGDAPSATQTPSPAVTAEPSGTTEPAVTQAPAATATPVAAQEYSAPYSLEFSDETVKASQSGSAYTLNNDGSVTISVSARYQGISFLLPDSLAERNYDTVTITYKDVVNIGSGYGCGLWGDKNDNKTEDVVAWDGTFADKDSAGELITSGTRQFTIAGNANSKAKNVKKCLLFHNDAEHDKTPSAQVTITAVVFSHSKYDSSLPTASPRPTATPEPSATPRPTAEPSITANPSSDGGFETENYVYASDYTLGYQWGKGIVAYQDGKQKSLEDAGVTIYSRQSDRPFMSEQLQGWNNAKLILTQPVRYTTPDGNAHDVESMLTNFDFIADPTAIDNSDVDGKLYVYGTTDGFSYAPNDGYTTDDGTTYNKGDMLPNAYSNHSLTILSTTDMVNWTDEGFMDTRNLTNLPSDSGNKIKSGYTGGNTWAPSGLKIDGDGDGKDEFYLFYTNGGSVGYVMADSPMGPWRDPLNKELCGKSLPNCDDCSTCFDPAVLADDKGNAYVYFGGLSRSSGRAVKIKFEEGTGEVQLDGDPVKLPTHAFFEDSEINQFNGKYYYSYCSDFSSQELTRQASICAYVSSDPLNICFDPTARESGKELEAYTDEDGVYHHFLGTILDNPSTIYGQSYNNHHHMQSFKGKNYIFYHSTVLNNSIHRDSKSYRNLHVDEIDVNKDTDEISITPSYEGASQIENFNPYVDYDGNKKVINATTTSYSAGVCSRRSDSRVKDGLSPMVLDEIDTGDWTKIQGVDFEDGAKTFSAVIASETDEAAVELYIDSPLKSENKAATIMIGNTGSTDTFKTFTKSLNKTISGVHDVYFVFRGTDYNVASWSFDKDSSDDDKKDDTEDGSLTHNVTLSKDNVYTSIEPGTVTYSEDGSVTYDVKGTYGGTGVFFSPAGNDTFNISDYSKLVIEASVTTADIPLTIGMYQYTSDKFWQSGNGLEMSGADYTSPDTANEKFTIEYDLDNVNLWQRENDISGVGLKALWNIGDKSGRLTVYSIKFVKADKSGLPELESIKGVSDPVFHHTGTSINYSELANKSKLDYLTTHYSSVSLENEMKPDSILGSWNPQFISVDDAKKNTADYVIPDSYTEDTVPQLNFGTIDKVLKICKAYNIKLRAHTLVWHSQTPEFFFKEGYSRDADAGYVTPGIMDARLEMYIRSVMHHVYTIEDGAYKDVVYTWDVANEYMHNDADNNWSAVYGNRAGENGLGNKPGYLKLAFQTAHDCLVEYGIEDKVSLVYNDFNTYFDCRDNIIEMVNYFNEEEKICDGVGMQSHLGVAFPSVDGYLDTVTKFLQAGFEVQITELDIGINPDDSSQTYEVQAEYVTKLMTGLINIQKNIGGITGITWWGMYDEISWRGGNSSEGNSHPLLFDKNMYDPKPAYYAFINAFK